MSDHHNLPPGAFNLPPGLSLRDVDPGADEKDCPRCGATLDRSEKECPYCGHLFNQEIIADCH